MNSAAPGVFLTAEWRHLAMLNYEVNPAILAPFIPAGTELDPWAGKVFVSIVGFLFLKTRVFGIPVPCHQNFEEVNLRFYVRRKAGDGWRRGVVFIKEIVPRPAIALVARRHYNEPYVALPMGHQIKIESGALKSAEYTWSFNGKQSSLKLITRGPATSLRAGSDAEFITEHYWGYNSQRDGSTMEYRVEHPRWLTYETAGATLDCDVTGLYGEPFCESLSRQPASSFLAEGSKIAVYRGVRL